MGCAVRVVRKAGAAAGLGQLVAVVLVAIAEAIVIKRLVPAVQLGTILTTSAIITAVIGLALQDTLGNLYGLDIPYYAEVNFDGFTKVVDAVGGVTIKVQIPVLDDNYPGDDGHTHRTNVHAGLQPITAAQALQNARSRQLSMDSGLAAGQVERQRVRRTGAAGGAPAALAAGREAVVEDGAVADLRAKVAEDSGERVALGDDADGLALGGAQVGRTPGHASGRREPAVAVEAFEAEDAALLDVGAGEDHDRAPLVAKALGPVRAAPDAPARPDRGRGC